MIRKTDFFEQIDDYCLAQLTEIQKIEFENELAGNLLLRKELKLRMEIWDSVSEKDIFILRNTLSIIAKQNIPANSQNNTFEILNEYSEIKEVSEVLSSEELVNFFDSLPKVHAYHHEVSARENVHAFYKEQRKIRSQAKKPNLYVFESEQEMEGLEEAILEKDILEFRQKLKQVAKSVEPKYNIEDIDDFIHGELSDSEFFEFERELAQNKYLAEEVELHKEIDIAVQEFDVMEMRNKISDIIRTETSWNVSEKSIEDFIDGILEDELLEEFYTELKDNTDLKAEVKLRKQINEFLGEKDVFKLREELKSAKEKSETKQVKMLIPETKSRQLKYWINRAAVVIVLIGLAGILGNGFVSVNKIYENYYENPSWAPERSMVNEQSLLYQAKSKYQNQEYADVINILNNLPNELNVNPVLLFYRAVSLQNLNLFEEAIFNYTKVIENGDNLYLEEAEWYRCLCYLKSGNRLQAKQELLAIIKRNGDFEHEAKAILRRLKYSIKIES